MPKIPSVLSCFVLAACGGGAEQLPEVMDVQFHDVTTAAGLGYEVRARPARTEVEMMSGGVTAADWDGDGWPDLLVTRVTGAPILYRNRQDGTFVDVTPPLFTDVLGDVATNGAAWVDIENDGDLDLYLTTTAHTRYYLFVSDGEGGFTEEGSARGVAVETERPHAGFGIAVGDYDLDGFVDLYVGEWASQTDTSIPTHTRLLRNRGVEAPGYFEDVTEAAGASLDASVGVNPKGSARGAWAFSPTFCDIDADGWPDLVVACDFGTSRILWNEGHGGFRDGTAEAGIGTDENGMGSAIGDFDGDGDLDWFVSSIWDANETCEGGSCGWGASGNRLYRNVGQRTFVDATDEMHVRDGGWGWGASFFDPDNDGDLDLALTNGMGTHAAPQFFSDPMRLWENTDGRYEDVGPLVGVRDVGQGRGLVTFDYDRDGDEDLFVVNNDGAPVLYRNDGGNRNAWLQVALVGVQSNAKGLGARVTVTADHVAQGDTLVREVQGGTRFLAQGPCTVHFGLGDVQQSMVTVQVVWPGGTTETFDGVSTRQRITIIEGAGIVRGQ